MSSSSSQSSTSPSPSISSSSSRSNNGGLIGSFFTPHKSPTPTSSTTQSTIPPSPSNTNPFASPSPQAQKTNKKTQKKTSSDTQSTPSPPPSSPPKFDLKNWAVEKLAEELQSEELMNPIFAATPIPPKLQTVVVVKFNFNTPALTIETVGQRICNLINSIEPDCQIVLHKLTICIRLSNTERTDEVLDLLCQHEEELSSLAKCPFSIKRMEDSTTFVVACFRTPKSSSIKGKTLKTLSDALKVPRAFVDSYYFPPNGDANSDEIFVRFKVVPKRLILNEISGTDLVSTLAPNLHFNFPLTPAPLRRECSACHLDHNDENCSLRIEFPEQFGVSSRSEIDLSVTPLGDLPLKRGSWSIPFPYPSNQSHPSSNNSDSFANRTKNGGRVLSPSPPSPCPPPENASPLGCVNIATQPSVPPSVSSQPPLPLQQGGNDGSPSRLTHLQDPCDMALSEAVSDILTGEGHTNTRKRRQMTTTSLPASPTHKVSQSPAPSPHKRTKQTPTPSQRPESELLSFSLSSSNQ